MKSYFYKMLIHYMELDEIWSLLPAITGRQVATIQNKHYTQSHYTSELGY